MKKSLCRHVSTRGLVHLLVAGQVLAAVPASTAAPAEPMVSLGALDAVVPEGLRRVPVNTTAADVQPPRVVPGFSEAPTDQEIFRARVFDEPLVPIGGTTTPEENRALADVLKLYAAGQDPEAFQPFLDFLSRHPRTAWRAALLTNLGIVYRHLGYFSRALDAWEEAWTLAKDEPSGPGKGVADRAIAQLAELNARIGRYERLDALFEEVGSRDIGGSAGEWLALVRQGRWKMEHEVGTSFRCGPFALERIFSFENPSREVPTVLARAESSKRGTSLKQIAGLAQRADLGLRMARREPGADLSLPAVVHWKAGHFAALLEERDGRYRAQDPTFGGEFWVSKAALDDESSGYFLTKKDVQIAGWKRVEDAEAETIWGRGVISGKEPPPPEEPEPNTCEPEPMAKYTFKLFSIGLRVFDAPVGYAPPIGPSVRFQVDYNQRDIFQPQTFSYSNLGPKWTFGWLSYIEDNPSNLAADALHYARGGGQSRFKGMPSGTGSSNINERNQSVLVRTSTSPIRYERRLNDGSIEVFTVAVGTMPRRVFMTQLIDPQGQSLTFAFDGSARLVSVTDAVGQVTTLSYTHPDPLKITKVTDPYGRAAVLDYDASGRLSRITDIIGIASTFTYAASDFIGAFTTPYGKTSFVTGGTGLDLWVEATDPLGGQARIEFRQLNNNPPPEPSPANMPNGVHNAFMYARNTFYWNKRALALHRGDLSKAHIYHWLHSKQNGALGVAILESEKAPLENRVWYNYPGQMGSSPAAFEGTSANRIAAGRVLDDGSTQLYRYEHNAAGKLINAIDSVGRETVYVYGTGSVPDANPMAGTGIDLLQVKQKRTSGATGCTPGTSTGCDLLASNTYDAQHRLLTSTDAAGQMTTYTYLADGRPATIVTPARNGPNGVPLTLAERTSTYTYYPDTDIPSQRKRLYRVTGPYTPVGSPGTSYTYDGYGRMRTGTDQEGYTLTYDYDAADRPTKTTYPDGSFTETIYNRLDPERRRDRMGRWSDTFFDAMRRVASTRDAEGRVVTYDWCTCGSLNRVIDARGNATSWERDTQGRVTKEIRADSVSAWEYTYEQTTSRLYRRKDPLNQVATYTYFKDNNLNQVMYSGEVISTPDVTLTYDPDYNRLKRVEDPITGQTNYTYHAVTVPPALGASRMATMDGPIPLTGDRLSYGYDEMGGLASLSLSGSTSYFRYDALGRLSGRDGVIGTFSYGYDGTSSRPAAVTYPSGQRTEYLYHPNSGDHRLQEIKNIAAGGVVLSKFNYTQDSVGNVRTWQQEASLTQPKVYELGNDRVDQLTTATLKTTGGSPTVLGTYGYAYDRAGNRTAESINTAVIQATYDSRDRLLQQQVGGSLRFAGSLNEPAGVTVAGNPAEVAGDNRFTGATTASNGVNSVPVVATDAAGNTRTQTYQVTVTGSGGTFTHDVNGNRTGDGTRTFEWDAENRLVAIVSGTHRSEFTYDGQGRRIRQIEKDGANTTADRRLVWCGTEICEERDGSGTIVTRQLDRNGFREGGSNFAWTRDHLGSIREVIDTAGAIRARYDYDPFGRRTKLLGDKEAGFGFAGLYAHLESGMALARRRAYDPQTSRWLNEDPIGLRGGINRYRYVRNNPARFMDPSGLCEEPCTANTGVKCSLCVCNWWIVWTGDCPDDKVNEEGPPFPRWHFCDPLPETPPDEGPEGEPDPDRPDQPNPPGSGPDDRDWPGPDGFAPEDPSDPSPPHDPGTLDWQHVYGVDSDHPVQTQDWGLNPVRPDNLREIP